MRWARYANVTFIKRIEIIFYIGAIVQEVYDFHFYVCDAERT